MKAVDKRLRKDKSDDESLDSSIQSLASSGKKSNKKKSLEKKTKDVTNPDPEHYDYPIEKLYFHYTKYRNIFFGKNEINKFSSDLGIDPHSFPMLVFYWKLGAKKLYRITYNEWKIGLTEMKISSLRELKAKIHTIAQDIRTSPEFRKFYYNIYDLVVFNPPGRMEIDLAIQLLEVIFQYQFKLLPHLIQYLRNSRTRQLRRAEFFAVYDFFILNTGDSKYFNYAAFWPDVLDDFHDWFLELQEEDKKSNEDTFSPRLTFNPPPMKE